MECRTGRVGTVVPDEVRQREAEIGELLDVECVANGFKPVAALDFSAYGRRKLRRLNTTEINRVIDSANDKGVEWLHHNSRGGMYLKSVFYLPQHQSTAVALMTVLWSFDDVPDRLQRVPYHALIGLLLGYTPESVHHLLKRDGHKTTLKQLTLFKRQVEAWTTTLTLADLPSLVTRRKRIPHV